MHVDVSLDVNVEMNVKAVISDLYAQEFISSHFATYPVVSFKILLFISIIKYYEFLLSK